MIPTPQDQYLQNHPEYHQPPEATKMSSLGLENIALCKTILKGATEDT